MRIGEYFFILAAIGVVGFLVITLISGSQCLEWKIVESIKSVRSGSITVVMTDGDQRKISTHQMELGQRICVRNNWLFRGE